MDLMLNLKLRPSFFFSFLVFIFLLKSPEFGSAATPKCISTDREALLTFKQSLTDVSGRLSSWSGPDCCEWTGVLCDVRTGHVTNIDLRNPSQVVNSDEYKRGCLRGKIHQSLTRLKFLSYLDLSSNDFNGLEIPEFIGHIVSLRYLNLSSSSFSGEVPASLGNLSKLEFLDLYAESFSDSGPFSLRASDLKWLSGLSSSLTYLNMGYVNLSGAGETWLQDFSKLTKLKELHLFNCEIKNLPTSLSTSANLKLLEVLDLSENSLNSPIPNWLFDLTSLRKLFLRWDFLQGSIPSGFKNLKLLEMLDLSNNLGLTGEVPAVLGELPQLNYLDLSANEFNGQIHGFLDASSKNKDNSLVFLDLSSNKLAGTLPESLGALSNLQILDLSSNSFTGSIPSSIGNMASLKKIDLSFNAMNGNIPESLGKLAELVDLDLMANTWEGVLLKSHFINLRSLKSFRLTTEPNRSLVFKVPSTWVPPFRLELINIENCQIGPKFPMWLQVQTELNSVTLRNTGIADTIPHSWFSGIASDVTYLILANNRIKGTLPQNLVFPKLNTIDLSSNNFQGPFPLWTTNATELRLYENSFSGPLPANINVLMPRMEKLYLFHNSFTGVIPSSLCEVSGLQILSLRNNRFSGSFPNCWHRQFMLYGIDASENSLSGEIPASLGALPSLSVLLLNQNALQGKIPDTLKNCSGLTNIDLGGNKLTGKVPSWLSKLSSLFMLRLQSNSLDGQIPDNLCSVPNLHILDLSGNKISGPVPKCMSNLTAIARGTTNFEVFQNLVFVVTRARKYQDIVNSINLSGNNLNGEIPAEILDLSYLRILNLSRNSITGSIPGDISKLGRLETLDLSRNMLSGAIPQSLGAISSLQKLNLSYNKLEGRIPMLPKFEDPSIYIGNELLCGKPLPKKCPKDVNRRLL
ncbi:LRRNT_2 domain-containing protein [Hirschfeldia incana]|nr:LRRNT_2 domain-containing protein [Hirschfeldia incana]